MSTGTEVTQEAAVTILTDDHFSTTAKAVELGRGLYDNLARYIRCQMAGLFGYIATFLGASIVNIARGVPLLPLQTLWVRFTTLSLQSVGLGYSKPAAGLMDRPPLPPSRPILTRGLIASRPRRPADGGRHPRRGQLGGPGSRARHSPDHGHGHVRAVPAVLLDRVQGRTGLGVLPRHLLRRDIPHHDQRVLPPAVVSTALGIFHTVMKTVTLDVVQCLICTAVALSVVAAAEIRKALLRRRAAAKAVQPAGAPRAGATTPERRRAPRSGPSMGGDPILAGIYTPAWACTRPEATASASAAWSRSVWSA